MLEKTSINNYENTIDLNSVKAKMNKNTEKRNLTMQSRGDRKNLSTVIVNKTTEENQVTYGE